MIDFYKSIYSYSISLLSEALECINPNTSLVQLILPLVSIVVDKYFSAQLEQSSLVGPRSL